MLYCISFRCTRQRVTQIKGLPPKKWHFQSQGNQQTNTLELATFICLQSYSYLDLIRKHLKGGEYGENSSFRVGNVEL